jgi:hypothetical protein
LINFQKKIKKLKKKTVKKNRVNQLKFLKNQSVRFGFGFISPEPKKPNRTQTEKNKKKLSQTGLNQFLSKKTS